MGAWNGHLEPYPHIGKSWSRYGEEESLRIVLTDLWTLYCEIEGIRQADCPMQGFFLSGQEHDNEYDNEHVGQKHEQ